MRCDQAQQLFDAYLADELSPSLRTELGAHRVQCEDCRRALALLEVTGHVISVDGEPVKLGGAFTDRLMACMAPAPAPWQRRMRWVAYVGVPMAAAAVIALAFLGAFDGNDTKVAGVKEKPSDIAPSLIPPPIDNVDGESMLPAGADDRLLQEWFDRTEQNISAKRESSESLQRALDLKILQLLDALEEAKAKDEAAAANGGTPPVKAEKDVTDGGDNR